MTSSVPRLVGSGEEYRIVLAPWGESLNMYALFKIAAMPNRLPEASTMSGPAVLFPEEARTKR